MHTIPFWCRLFENKDCHDTNDKGNIDNEGFHAGCDNILDPGIVNWTNVGIYQQSLSASTRTEQLSRLPGRRRALLTSLDMVYRILPGSNTQGVWARIQGGWNRMKLDRHGSKAA